MRLSTLFLAFSFGTRFALAELCTWPMHNAASNVSTCGPPDSPHSRFCCAENDYCTDVGICISAEFTNLWRASCSLSNYPITTNDTSYDLSNATDADTTGTPEQGCPNFCMDVVGSSERLTYCGEASFCCWGGDAVFCDCSWEHYAWSFQGGINVVSQVVREWQGAGAWGYREVDCGDDVGCKGVSFKTANASLSVPLKAAVQVANGTSTGTSGPTKSSASNSAETGSKKSPLAIIVGVIVGVLVIILIGAIIFLFRYRRGAKRRLIAATTGSEPSSHGENVLAKAELSENETAQLRRRHELDSPSTKIKNIAGNDGTGVFEIGGKNDTHGKLGSVQIYELSAQRD